jgi:hypothetical protein
MRYEQLREEMIRDINKYSQVEQFLIIARIKLIDEVLKRGQPTRLAKESKEELCKLRRI